MTAPIAVTATAWTDLGSGPLQIQVKAQPISIIMADTMPAPTDEGFDLRFKGQIDTVPTTTHVWAKSVGSPNSVSYVTVAMLDTATGDPVADVALGSTTDAPATSGGNGSIISILKGIFAKLTAGIGITGTVTENTLETSIGAQTDAAVPGTNGSVIALLKGIYALIAGQSPVSTTAAASSLVIKKAAGTLTWLSVSGVLAGWIMLFDATSAPADGVVSPKVALPVTLAGLVLSSPMSFGTGIVAVFSSTGPFLKTASATAFISATAV